MFPRRVGLPAEHAGQFGDAVFGGEELDLGIRVAKTLHGGNTYLQLSQTRAKLRS
jgi:hypothetical protein